FFFFQAEDGIRDRNVTGVQTCALPISWLGLSEVTDVSLSHVVISDRINVRPRHDGRIWVQVPFAEHRVEEGESPQLLQEVRSVMETELEQLFGTRIAVEDGIFSGRSFPE